MKKLYVYCTKTNCSKAERCPDSKVVLTINSYDTENFYWTCYANEHWYFSKETGPEALNFNKTSLLAYRIFKEFNECLDQA